MERKIDALVITDAMLSHQMITLCGVAHACKIPMASVQESKKTTQEAKTKKLL
jgi:hypothetical protein